MKSFGAPALLSLVLTALLAYNVHAISQVSRTGRYLYTADGSRFYIKGVAYQQQGHFLFITLSFRAHLP